MAKMACGACVAWAAATLSLLTGCVVEAVPPPPPNGVAVSGPPPQPVNEMRPPPPDARMVWVAGYWHWTGMQYTWIPGHWESAPPGASWRAPRYSVREGAYFYEPGGWLRTP
jgi:WXXGXW repeat (2 copies)